LTTFTSEDLQSALKGADDMSSKGYEEGYLGDAIRFKMKRDKKRFWAGDNVSDYVTGEDKEKLIDEATEAFETVLDRLLIDRENDPNSQGTARRLAKMYFNEIMAGRYEQAPDATAFPNDSADRYEGMLLYVASFVVCAVIIISLCLVLPILVLLPLINLLALANTHASLSGVQDEVLSRRNFVTTSPARLAKLLTPKT